MKTRPEKNEYSPYHDRYVSLVPETEILPVLQKQVEEIQLLAARITPELETFRYAPDKWSVREVFGHIVDCERVFAYRAFCISRGDTALFPGFEQDDYVAHSHDHERPLAEIVDELLLLRKSNLAFLRVLQDDGWKRVGTVNNNPLSVLALGYIMAGHIRHHIHVLQQKYGIEHCPEQLRYNA